MRKDEEEFSLSDDHSGARHSSVEIGQPVPGPRPSTFVSRRNWPVLIFSLLFASCIAFAYCWFNTDIGRSGSRPSTLDSRPRIWLEAKTNLPGYTFVEEPVSEEVKKILGSTNILNGTFDRIADRSLEYADRKNSALA